MYKSLSIGIVKSSFVLTSLMNRIFRDLIGENIEILYDDISLHTSGIDSHKKLLEKVLKRLREWGITVSKRMLFLFQTRIKFVGYIF